jgi:DNA polymerase elongation subunit (family B)
VHVEACSTYRITVTMENTYANPTVTPIETLGGCINMYRMENLLDNRGMTMLMNAGWIIISSWMENVPRIPIDDEVVVVPSVSYRLARGSDRMIVNADIIVGMPDDTIVNIDADTPGERTGYVPATNEMWMLRLAAIAGFGPGSGGGPGLVPCAEAPKFWVVGLDIEQSTYERRGGVPLPHDPIISITISSGGWYDNSCPDVCYCIYTFGYHREVTLDNGRKPVFIKTNTSEAAVQKAYEIVSGLSPDFVAIHNGFGFDMKRLAAHSSKMVASRNQYERRRLGNSGTGVMCRYPNGTMVVDSMYYIDKYVRRDWDSISLANIAKKLGLPPKLDVDDMMVEVSDNYDVTDMLIYNARDSDLHAWVTRNTSVCEIMYMLAGSSRCTMWDAIAGSSGIMVLTKLGSTALSMGMRLDMSGTAESDEREFEGGFVFEPKPGCYKGVVVIDGDSLYGSIMSKLGIFVDRCASAGSARELAERVGRDIEQALDEMEIGDVIEHDSTILMKDKTEYMCIIPGKPTLMSMVQDSNISERSIAKKNGDTPRATALKIMTVSGFGFLGSKHGVINSKTCAKIITYCARKYLKVMIEGASLCDYETIYGDTDSIFIHIGARTEAGCMTGGLKVKSKIKEITKGTVFERISADIKGNYSSIVISAKKKYEGVNWDGSLDTKGLAIVKKDSLPIVKYSLSKVMTVLNSDLSDKQKVESLITIVGKVMHGIQAGKIPPKSQVTETKISGQPHYVYRDVNWKQKKILIGVGIEPRDINKKWVAQRVASAINSVLTTVGMNSVSELMFGYETRRLSKVSRLKPRSCTSAGTRP